MAPPNWSSEIEISRKCVKQINLMTGKERPLYVCVCGDLVDTESSFSGAIASWKKVMTGWERNLVFEQVSRFMCHVFVLDHVYNSTHSHPTFVSSYLSKFVTSSVCGPAWTKTLLWYVFVVIMTSETNQQENLLIIGLPNSVTTF